ncbi:MAG: hypothetical protein MUC95_06980, partial [Spirochaetes bacterium]|nr:hypothetical protein [Spirochaetota bacterium]
MKIFYHKIFAFMLLLASPALFGQGNVQDYKNMMDNPLYEVSYLYSNYEREKALKILGSIFDNPKYKTGAYIDMGQIMENEKNFRLAEKNYNTAYQAGDKTAYVYLHSLYRTYNT